MALWKTGLEVWTRAARPDLLEAVYQLRYGYEPEPAEIVLRGLLAPLD